jgi:hypothetical protein
LWSLCFGAIVLSIGGVTVLPPNISFKRTREKPRAA